MSGVNLATFSFVAFACIAFSASNEVSVTISSYHLGLFSGLRERTGQNKQCLFPRVRPYPFFPLYLSFEEQQTCVCCLLIGLIKKKVQLCWGKGLKAFFSSLWLNFAVSFINLVNNSRVELGANCNILADRLIVQERLSQILKSLVF